MRIARIVLIGLVVAGGVFAQHWPGDGAPYIKSGVDLQGHSRFFLSSDDIEMMLDYTVRYDSDQRLYDYADSSLYNGLTIGGYYRALKNLKVGAFYRAQFGARHDQDWIDGPVDWMWRDTSDRLEHVLIADATPRFLLEFLPGENWVLSVKNRYEVTLYEQDGVSHNLQSLLVRPGLSYFLLRDREPFINASVQYGVYFPLNFGENLWYRRGPYVNLMYHLLPGLSADMSVSYQTVYWSESAEFDIAWPNNRYARPVYKHWAVDVGMIYKLAR